MGQSVANRRPVNPVLTAAAQDQSVPHNFLYGQGVLQRVDVTEIGSTGTILIRDGRNSRGEGNLDIDRAPGTLGQKVYTHADSSDDFKVRDFRLRDEIPVEDGNDTLYANEEIHRTRNLVTTLQIEIEKLIDDLFFNTGNLDPKNAKGDAATASPWTSQAVGAVTGQASAAFENQTAVPLKQMLQVMRNIENASGKLPDTLILGRDVAFALQSHMDFLGVIGTHAQGLAGGAPIVPLVDVANAISQRLGVRVFVQSLRYDSANAGQSESLSDLLGAKAYWMGRLGNGDSNAARVIRRGQQNVLETNDVAALTLFRQPDPEVNVGGLQGAPALGASWYGKRKFDDERDVIRLYAGTNEVNHVINSSLGWRVTAAVS